MQSFNLLWFDQFIRQWWTYSHVQTSFQLGTQNHRPNILPINPYRVHRIGGNGLAETLKNPIYSIIQRRTAAANYKSKFSEWPLSEVHRLKSGPTTMFISWSTYKIRFTGCIPQQSLCSTRYKNRWLSVDGLSISGPKDHFYILFNDSLDTFCILHFSWNIFFQSNEKNWISIY